MLFSTPYLPLTLILPTWRIWWAPNNASKWQMEFNSAFKGLKTRESLRSLNECILSTRGLGIWLLYRGDRVQDTTTILDAISVFKDDLYSEDTVLYRYSPHNYVSVNYVPHIRRWSHKIMILKYNIVIPLCYDYLKKHAVQVCSVGAMGYI
jgi:hypothetical protein